MQMPTLLSYAVSPSFVPTGEVVTLEIIVSNSIGEPVRCSEIVFTLPAGQDLTTDFGSISVAPAASTGWSISGDGTGNFHASPGGTVVGLGVGSSIAFIISGMKVPDAPGLAVITVCENSGTPEQERVASLNIPKVQSGLAITKFVGAPVSVASGEVALLSYACVGAENCSLSWPGDSMPISPTSSDMEVRPFVSTTYTLTASNDEGSVSQQINITVIEAAADTGTSRGSKVGDYGVTRPPGVALPNKSAPSLLKRFAWRIRTVLLGGARRE